jgi:glycosyltransferase involved in cell wall biosynthesis
MKIVHIQQYFDEAMGYQENLLPYYQMLLGHEVVVLTSTRTNGFNGKPRIQPAGQQTENGFRVVRLDIRFDWPGKFVCFRNLETALESEKPDYIFHHSVTSPSIAVVCAYKKKHPSVFLALDNHADCNISIRNPVVRWLYYQLIWRQFLAWQDRWINLYFGVTPGRCLFLTEEMGVPSSKVRLLPIGADVNHLPDTRDRESFYREFQLVGGELIFVHGGKITPEKQIDRLVEAFSRIDDPKARLFLFGEIKDPKVARLVELDARIRFLGWLNRQETLNLLSNSDLGVWPTQHTTLLEDCVAVGLPLMVRYYGSTSHLISRSGIFIYEGSVREIQDRLQLVLENRSLLDSFKQAAKEQREVLSYLRIADESVTYAQNPAPLPLHQVLMSESYSDLNYPGFRYFNPKGSDKS